MSIESDRTTPDDLDFRIARLELDRGDVLVVKSDRKFSDQGHENLKRALPPGVRVLYIPNDVELSVLTKAEIDGRES